jgi:hypothetical protein
VCDYFRELKNNRLIRKMEPTLKELRAKAKELRTKVSSAPISKATADQLKAEIAFFERAAKAEATREQRMANLAKIKEMKAEAPAKEEKKNQKSKQVMMMEDTRVVQVPKVKTTRKMKKEKDLSDE